MTAATSSVIAAGVGAAGSIAGGMMQGSGAEEAAATQAAGAQVNAAALKAAGKKGDALLTKSGKKADKRLAAGYKGARKDMRPYDKLGLKGSNELANYLGITRQKGNRARKQYGAYTKPYTQADLMRDPVYRTELGENVRAWDQSAASRGSLMSGNTVAGLRELTASGIQRGYERDWNQRERQFNAYSGLNNMGLGVRTNLAQARMSTAGSRASTGVNVGANRANTLLQGAGAQAGYNQMAADARGSGSLAQGTAMGNAFGNIGTMGMMYGAGAFSNNRTQPYTLGGPGTYKPNFTVSG